MSVHRSLARLAASLRLVEVAVSGAIAVSSFSVLSLLGGAAEGETRREGAEAAGYFLTECGRGRVSTHPTILKAD